MNLPEITPETINEIVGDGVMSLKGKDYLQVAHRVVRFRYMNPTATIYTEVEQIGETHYVKATIAEGYDVRATAYKEVKFGGKGAAAQYPLECAETGAIGRALALCGFGTLSGDLDESDQLADSPLVTGK